MIWVIVIVGLVVITLVVMEWRSRNKPLLPGLQDGDPYRYRGSGKPIIGGNDVDQPHD